MLDSFLHGVFYPLEDSDFFDFLFKDYSIKKFDSIGSLLSSTDCKSKTVFVKQPYPWVDRVEQILKQYHNADLDFCIVATELHEHDYRFYCRYDKPNITYFINGCFNFNLKYSKVYTHMDWFRETKDHYLQTKFTADFKNKLYYFDALLGRNKPHRLIAYNTIKDNLKIYTKFNSKIENINLNEWDVGVDNFSIPTGHLHSVEHVNYNGSLTRISQIIPEKIYDQCYYSLIAETHAGNSMVFLTEKTAKPLIAKRLFITVGNRYSLKFLHQLGFKTFSDVIDESYDSIEATNDRFAAALEQVNVLCNRDPIEVIELIKPIVEHNHQLIMNTDWLLHFRKHVSSKFKAG